MKVPMKIDKEIIEAITMTDDERRIKVIRGYAFGTAEARHHVDFLLTQLDAAKELAEKRLEALMHSVECSGTAWSQVQQSLVDCLKCAEAKRLVDQHGD